MRTIRANQRRRSPANVKGSRAVGPPRYQAGVGSVSMRLSFEFDISDAELSSLGFLRSRSRRTDACSPALAYCYPRFAGLLARPYGRADQVELDRFSSEQEIRQKLENLQRSRPYQRLTTDVRNQGKDFTRGYTSEG